MSFEKGTNKQKGLFATDPMWLASPPAHHVSKLGADGGGGVEDHVDDLSEKPVVVVRSGRHLADGPEEEEEIFG